MSLKLTDGDYTVTDGVPDTVELEELLLQGAVLALTARRGKFYPDKNYGSTLKEPYAAPFNEYALARARAALDGYDGVFVKSAEVTSEKILFTLIINNEERQAEIKLDNNL